MLDWGNCALNATSTDPAYFRARAREFRRQAGGTGDAVIHRELLRLAEIYERMAENAEIEARAGGGKG
jgi:hypothetical protein